MYISNTTGLMLQTMLYLANQSSKAVNTLYDFPPAAKSDINEVKCYGVYGCFPLNGLWTTNTRQINVHPQKPSEIHTNFAVFNSKNADYPLLIDLNDPDGIKNLGINPHGKIFLIGHGYLEAGDRPWMQEIAKILISTEMEETASVIMIDWGGGSSPPYVQAVANIRLVGAIAAHVVHLIYEELHMPNLDRVHIIGHSLGAHLAGYTGYYLQRDFGLKLGRISALDPAEPLFTDTDPVVRLDKTDAKFVDVIHTDANPLMSGGLGMLKPVGHIDFYPNGGFDNPGCSLKFEEYMKNKDNSFFWSMQQFLGCNHIRSHQYYIESIKTRCPFNAITCDSYESFVAGKCTKCGENKNFCLKFGYNSYSSYKKLVESGAIKEDTSLVAYLMTGSQKPFCRVHYRMTIKISSSDESALHGGEIGTLSVKLHSRRKKSTEKIPFSAQPLFFEPGFQYTSVTPGKDIKEPTYATVFWEYQTNLLNPLTWRILSSPRIYIDYIIIESIEHQTTLKLCPIFNSPILSGSDNILEENYCNE